MSRAPLSQAGPTAVEPMLAPTDRHNRAPAIDDLPNPAAEAAVWLHSPADFSYVRVSPIELPSRARFPRTQSDYYNALGLLVGYTVALPHVRSDWWLRRFHRHVFWLKRHDRDLDPTGVYADARTGPVEAADPRWLARLLGGER